MWTKKLHVYLTMMHAPRLPVLCAVMLVVAVAQAAAQAGDGWQAPDQPPPPSFLPPGVPKKFLSKGVPEPARFDIPKEKTKPLQSYGPAETPEDVENIGGEVVQEPDGRLWEVHGHAYNLEEPSGGELGGTGRVNGHAGNVGKVWQGIGTKEEQRHFVGEVSDGVEAAEMSGVGGDERQGSIPETGPGEDKDPQVPGDESADWSREADLWRYQAGEWEEVRLPDPSYPSLTTPATPASVLVVTSVDKVEIERSLEGLRNVTIHYRYYLSDSYHPDTLPELKVYLVKDGSRELLPVETTERAWQNQTIPVPEADNASIVIEGWLKAKGDIIALSDLYTTGVTAGQDEAQDADPNQLTVTANSTENDTSTLESGGNWSTDSGDQDNATRSSIGDDTQLDATQSPEEEDTEEGTGTEKPTNEFELEASTSIPEGQINGQDNESTDVVVFNSSMSSSDNMTSGGNISSDLQDAIKTTDTENSEKPEDGSSTTTTADGETAASVNSTEDAFETSGKEENITLSVPGVTTDSLQANGSVSLLDGNATVTGDPLISSEASVNSETANTVTEETTFTGGQNLSDIISTTDEDNSDTTLGRPDFNTTLEDVTGGTAFPIGVIMGSTPPPAGNGTEAVMAVPMSSTSWQVFQIFLVLCVMGLLALGFLYWKRKHRQDDEIPVFTRHTDYHNPTFTMEDAANFMSRGGRNTYKTIE